MPRPPHARCSSASSRPRHHPQQLPRTKVSFISEIARRNLQRIIRYSDSLTCPRQVTKLKNYLFLLLCLKIGQRQPQIFSPKVTNICEADVQWKLNFCSETIEATSRALKIIECCKYTAQIFPKLSSDEFCAKFSAFRVTAVTNVGPTC